MPLEDLDVEVDSSPANGMSGVNDAGSPPVSQDVADPEPSTGAEGTDAPESNQEAPEDYSGGLMDAIEEAVGSSSEDEDADSADSVSEMTPDDGETDADADDKPKADGESDEAGEGEEDENGEKLPPFHQHPRWQEMIRDRNDLRAQVDQFRERATEYDKIHQFMETNGLTPDEVARSIQTMALIRNNPAQAREVLAREMEQLDRFTGNRLPDDLERDVQDGYITPERAQELARLRNEQSFTQRQADQQRQAAEAARRQAEQQQVESQQTQALESQKNAVRQWETQLKSRDPDYERIQPLVYRELRMLAQDQPARTPDEAVELAKTALKNVKAQVRQLTPKREPVNPGPSSSQSGGTAGSANQPGSLLEAVMQAAGPN